MTPLLALGQGVLFGIGAVVFIAVFTAALSLAYARFAELGEEAERRTPSER
jgi:hypothetical protein